ncbi:MAG: DUF1616 domain-containing protein [Candidatus Heimdallarchaeota archaeon]|nr:DUF1616 domain-containing protein [Candidatus Heimdallarchaeota archaeon]MBY8993050.1 DUF1616 domain-containing protein [Candidatus Heimdallarchaeota archaeon]
MSKEKKSKNKGKEKIEAAKRKEEISKQIETVLKENKPKDVRSLVKIIEEKYETPEEEILSVIREREINQNITLQEPIPVSTELPKKPREYFIKNNYYTKEFWTSIGVIALVLIFVLVDVDEGFFFYLRYAVVSFFMLILTGWSLTSAIFPEINDELRFLERVATATGLSILVLILDGVFLNYTFHFTPLSIGLSLIIITLVCMIVTFILRIKLARDGFIFKRKQKKITTEMKEEKLD